MAISHKSDDSAQIPQWWSADMFSQAEDMTFWHNFEGTEGSNMPIIRKDDLTVKAGDTIKTDIVLALTGAGQTGDTTSLRGNEEAMKFRQMSFTVDELAHAVGWTELSAILNLHNKRTTGLNQLKKWAAGKLDTAVFNELTGVGTTIPDANKWACGSASSRATVADGNGTGRLQLADLVQMKAYAQKTLKIEPFRTEDGNEYFGLAVDPFALMELKLYDTAWSQAQRDARERSADNPVFTGAAGMYDGVILYPTNRVPTSSNGSVNVADNVFFGAQALTRGYAFYPDWREEVSDYGRQFGIATVMVKGEKITVFDLTSAGGASAANLTWIGGMVVYSAAVAPGQP